jgi:hypothetical protein
MFGTGARFAEYGITGGFFILLQLLILGWAVPGGVSSAVQLTAALMAGLDGKDLAPLFPAIQSLSVALALLSVFITGLLLDLIGSFFWMWEARLFRFHLIRNGKWIVRLIEAEMPDQKREYVCFLTLLDGISPRQRWRSFYESLKFWSASARRRRSRISLGLMRRTQQTFRRLESAFVAKIVVAGVRTDFLSEQMSISRMSRAITIAIYLSGLEFYSASSYRVAILRQSDYLTSFGQGVAFAGAISVFAIFFPVIIVRASYSRFCLILFSQVYAISRLSKPS